MYWKPKTRLGKMVEKGEITNMADALRTRLPLREPEIVDILLPDLEDEVLDVNMVQRMTDSGRRVRFAVTTVVGNNNGYVGLGKAKGKEVGPTIRKAIDNSKLNIIEVRRGCGSWECGCGTPHSLPFDVSGKKGSVRVTFKPAPRGIALAVGDVAKPVLRLAGIKDAWAFTKGHTKTTANYAAAAFEALKKTAEMRVLKSQEDEMHITTGIIPGTEVERVIEEPEVEGEKEPEAAVKEQMKEEKDKKKDEGKKEIEGEKKEEPDKKEKDVDKTKVEEDTK
ncbi:MAG: 30S ribosomal protein S5 [Thermoplasmata archaeon]|nr:MAG: 30S ribosomal protein S5 [Thermoplasmata archaeon]